MSEHVDCFKCGATMRNVMRAPGLQPMGGTCFVSYGHYGSGVFDPMDGSYIQIVLCDECLLDNMSPQNTPALTPQEKADD